MEFKTILKLDDIEVTQSERGTISFATNDKSNAMFDLVQRIFELEEMLEKKLDLIRCGIGVNYSGAPMDNEKYLEVTRLLAKGHESSMENSEL